LFLKVTQRDQIDLFNLRGTPAMFYYVMLALTAAAFMLCAWLLRSRAGYYWQAIRENEPAAQALGINTFRWKMLAVAISAALTALAGVFQAFYYNNLFPEQLFSLSRSIEVMLGPSHWRRRHIVRPHHRRRAVNAAGRRRYRIGYGSRLGRTRREAVDLRRRAFSRRRLSAPRYLAVAGASFEGVAMNALLELRSVSKSFLGLRAVNQASLLMEADHNGAHRPQRRRQNDTIQYGRRRFSARQRRNYFCRQTHRWPARRSSLRRRHRPHLSARQTVRRTHGDRQCHRRRASSRFSVGQARKYAETILAMLGLGAKRDLPCRDTTPPLSVNGLRSRALLRPGRKLCCSTKALAGLRPTECDEIAAVLREINQRDGIAIVLIEHVMRAVMALAQTVIVLHHGEVIAQGTPAQVMREPAVIESYLGEDAKT
jgi:ABC-type branched-subunit amino acid transport system ATPase component